MHKIEFDKIMYGLYSVIHSIPYLLAILNYLHSFSPNLGLVIRADPLHGSTTDKPDTRS